MSAVEQRARFEAWAESEGLIGVSHGIMSVNSQTETAWRAWQAALASQAQVPDGYVLVPREPTDRMLEAGLSGLSGAGVDSALHEDAAECWSAMLAAAPEVSG